MGLFNKKKESLFQRVTLPIEPNLDKEWLAVKYPGHEFNTGSILEVPPGTICIAVHAGKIEHIFESGSTKLSTENYPFIKRFVKGLYGGEVPFSMNFYYINRTAQHEFYWGTPSPITVESMAPEDMGITYNFGARGTYYLRIKHYQFFYEWILGSLAEGEFVYWDDVADKVRNYINPKVIEFLSTYVYDNQIGFGRIQAMAGPCSDAIKEKLKPELESSFGLEFQNFNTIIAIDQKDRDAFNEARKEVQRAAQQGRLSDVAYARGIQSRQMDVMSDMANNNGALGGMMGAGFGLGAGFSMMGQAGNVIQGNTQNTMSGNNVQYGNNGGPQGPQSSGMGPTQPAGMNCPHCNTTVPAGSKFCPSCGGSLASSFCSNCGSKLAPGAAFCSNCGTKVGG